MNKNNAGFASINYKGRAVKHDYIDAGASTVYITHFNRGTYPGNKPRKHACFQMGFWCWKQAREQPIEAIKFKLRRILK